MPFQWPLFLQWVSFIFNNLTQFSSKGAACYFCMIFVCMTLCRVVSANLNPLGSSLLEQPGFSRWWEACSLNAAGLRLPAIHLFCPVLSAIWKHHVKHSSFYQWANARGKRHCSLCKSSCKETEVKPLPFWNENMKLKCINASKSREGGSINRLGSGKKESSCSCAQWIMNLQTPANDCQSPSRVND